MANINFLENEVISKAISENIEPKIYPVVNKIKYVL